MVAFLTKEGERIAEKMYESMQCAQDRLLSPLRSEYRSAFVAMLTELVEGSSKYSVLTPGATGHQEDHDLED